MNWEYRRVASSSGFSIDRTRGDDLLDFPIEKARLRATYFYMSVAAVTTIGYGWVLDKRTVRVSSNKSLKSDSTKISLALCGASGSAILHRRLHRGSVQRTYVIKRIRTAFQ